MQLSDNRRGMIDCHVRNTDGCVHLEGTNVVAYHSSEHVKSFSGSLKAFNSRFEVTGVKVVKKTCAFEQFSLKADSSADLQRSGESANSESMSELHEDVKFQTSQVTQEPPSDECDVVFGK